MLSNYQGSRLLLLLWFLLLLLSVLSRVYVIIVVVVIYFIKGRCCCCWLLVLLSVYIYVLMCLFSTSINKIRVTTIISQQHFICLSPYTWSHHNFFFFKWPLCKVVSKLGGVKVFVNFCCDPKFLIMIFAPFIWLYIILLIFWFHRF